MTFLTAADLMNWYLYGQAKRLTDLIDDVLIRSGVNPAAIVVQHKSDNTNGLRCFSLGAIFAVFKYIFEDPHFSPSVYIKQTLATLFMGGFYGLNLQERCVSRRASWIGNTSPSYCAFLIALMIYVTPSSAFAADAWPTLPGDRVDIIVKDTHFSMPTTKYELANVIFSDRSLEHKMTLSAVVHDADRAKALFSSTSFIFIWFGPSANDNDAWLGFADAHNLGGMSAGFTVGPGSTTQCKSQEASYDRVKQSFQNKLTGEETDRWSAGDGYESRTYVNTQATDGLMFGGINCDALNSCGSITCLSSTLSFSFQFSSNRYPRKSWRDVLQRVDRTVRNILLMKQ